MTPFSLNIKGVLHEFNRPVVMAIVNVTPDSFWAGSRVDPGSIVAFAKSMLDQGADILDIGGCSTRPGSTPVSEEEELRRVIPAIEIIHRLLPDALISVDTFRPRVAREAVAAGAAMINDVNGLDDDMLATVTELHVPYVLTHNVDVTGVAPKEVVPTVVQQLQSKTRRLSLAGVADVIIDPGLGFGKTLEENYSLLNNLELFRTLERPILIGASRKSLITKLLDITPEEALNGTTAINTIALLKGADILRVHDPLAAAQAAKIVQQCLTC